MIRRSMQSVRERLAGYSWLSDLPAMLCWAALVGVLGALATIAFHEGMRLVQHVFTGRRGSIVGVTAELPWYGRLLFPLFGGVLAGSLLWASKQFKENTHSDYMEAVAIGDGRLSLRQGMLRSLS